MIRLIIFVVLLAVLITYAIIPLIKYFRRFFKAEGKRIAKQFEDEPKNNDDNEENV